MKVFWTKFALDSLKDIFTYYKDNANIKIANNIKNSILQSTRQLEFQPQSGAVETFLLHLNEEYRFIIRGNYKVIYKIQHKKLFITDVFDTRQNPAKIYRNTQTDMNLNEPDISEFNK
jgi:plasmid stabilization system protein ParE